MIGHRNAAILPSRVIWTLISREFAAYLTVLLTKLTITWSTLSLSAKTCSSIFSGGNDLELSLRTNVIAAILHHLRDGKDRPVQMELACIAFTRIEQIFDQSTHLIDTFIRLLHQLGQHRGRGLVLQAVEQL
ncbi:hypothetical protein [Mucilaginibacter sp. SP1R1]|uniref:hypothetical protein n=1 Tax=Mucilaginibacter sp. SP1R1 TaxID=2723091 RepID=UPI003B00B902